MKWYNVENYSTLEISEKGDVRGKPYSIYVGTRLIQRKGRWKKVNQYNEIFVRENGVNNTVRVDRLIRGKLVD
jgi:hypothetical protein